MNRNARNRFVAWLGIAAMWLAIVAPVVSQNLAARNAALDPQAALCTVDTLAGLFASADEHASHLHANAPADEHASADHAGHLDACSYCGLLAHHLPVASSVARSVTRIERVARVAPMAAHGDVCPKSFNAACPRAPPVVS